MSEVSELCAKLQDLAALPADQPFGLPGRFYTSRAWFDRECDTLLREGWHGVGRADEIPQSGDYFTLKILNEPLIVIRDDAGEVRVLSNVCRHRGMPLVQGKGNVTRFVCPYHAWSYARDGALLRAPRMENAGFDVANCRLNSFPVTLWRGFIYVSLSASPVPFDIGAEPLDEMIAPYEPDSFRLVHEAREIWRTNWKCLVENFMEGYHLSVVHPRTLHGYTPTGLAKKGVSGPGFTSYHANYPQDIPARGTGAPGLNAAERHRSSLFARFPNQVASQSASLLVSLYIFPRHAEEIEVKWTMSVRGEDLDDETIAQRIALWEEVNREDREKLELMQASLRSGHSLSGPLAGEDYEGTIRDFLLWLAYQDAGFETGLSVA